MTVCERSLSRRFQILDMPERLTPNPALNRTGRYAVSCSATSVAVGELA
jgi:hypothetical protein